MILEREFPPDSRVEKEISSLMEAGHEVAIATYTFINGPGVERKYGYTIYRRPISNLMFKLSAACLIIPLYFRYWKKYIKSIQREFPFDAIHVHDLPLSKTGYYFKKRSGAKLICDQHEYYSNWIVHTAHLNRGIGRVVNWLSDWKNYERKYLHKADLVITVEEPLRQLYIKETGIMPDKIIVTPNTPSEDFLKRKPDDNTVLNRYKDNFVIFYAGTIDVLRSLDIVIKALVNLSKEIPNIKFVIAGMMMKNFDPVKLAKQLKVDQFVDYVGFMPIEELPLYLEASNVCVNISRVVRDEQNNTIATKVYQYIISNKPLIVGQGRMVRTMVEKYNLGLSISDGDPGDFAEKVKYIYKHPELETEFAENCKKVKDKFVWEKTVNDLINAYDKF